VTRRNSSRLRTLLRRLVPGTSIPDDADLVVVQEEQQRLSWRALFSGRSRVTTMLLWAGYFAESMTYLTLLSWLPVLLEAVGLTPAGASLAFSYASVGSVFAILLVAKPLDRFGPLVIAALAIVGAAAILRLSTAGLSAQAITATAVAVVACCGAAHNSLHGVVGQFYPTRIRGQGVGWAAGIGRLAGMIGPVAIGYLLSADLPPRRILGWIASPYLVVAVVGLLLARISAKGRLEPR
jgi:MFS transporter, AAHS family, 4-hydroxybenzoate transporter